jgi:hypothetical protein
MNIATQKSELINWINSIEDITILNKIATIKTEETFDFDKKGQRSISIDDARKKSKEFIKSLAWKK